MDLIAEVQAESDVAQMRYGDFTSTHEAFGVLVEEVDELLRAIRSNKLESVRAEAIQVSAVALRLASQCRADAAFAARSSK